MNRRLIMAGSGLAATAALTNCACAIQAADKRLSPARNRRHLRSVRERDRFMPPTPPPLPMTAVDRRSLLTGGMLGLGLIAAPLSAQTASGFTHGVASGEPSARSVLLWTRYAGKQD